MNISFSCLIKAWVVLFYRRDLTLVNVTRYYHRKAPRDPHYILFLIFFSCYEWFWIQLHSGTFSYIAIKTEKVYVLSLNLHVSNNWDWNPNTWEYESVAESLSKTFECCTLTISLMTTMTPTTIVCINNIWNKWLLRHWASSLISEYWNQYYSLLYNSAFTRVKKRSQRVQIYYVIIDLFVAMAKESLLWSVICHP